MLPGTLVDLRLAERPDLSMLAAWFNDIDFNGEFEPFEQSSLSETERDFEAKPDQRWWIVQEKDATPVGYVGHGKADGGCWIGYVLAPAARGRGYGSEAVLLIVDYLFLHKDIGRIQAETTVERRLAARPGKGRVHARGHPAPHLLQPGQVARHRDVQPPPRGVGCAEDPAGRPALTRSAARPVVATRAGRCSASPRG